jgi:phosphopantetheinyl transferase
MRSYLSAIERAEYAARSPRAQGQWLLGRIAVKDAVRHLLRDNGSVTGPFYPAEIRVSNEESGRPRVTGLHGTRLPPLEVSLAHSGEVGVALIGPGSDGDGDGDGDQGSPVIGTGVGIDVEQIVPRDQAAYDAAFSDPEKALLRALAAADPAPRDEADQLWFARFWTAKEAVAKAEGTGLDGSPKSFAVLTADPADLSLIVEARRGPGPVRRHRVRTAALANPEDLTTRRYSVAWTDGTDTHTENQERDS